MDWNTVGHTRIKEKFSRMINGEQFNHAILLTGPEGIGKRTLVFEYAQRVLNVSNPLSHADFAYLDLSKSVSAAELRVFLQLLHGKPIAGSCRIAVLDNLDSLSVAGSNALLKELEEPSPACFYFLIAARLPMPTIVSRAEVMTCYNLTDEQMILFARQKNILPQDSYLRLAGGSPALLERLSSESEWAKQVGKVVQFMSSLLSADLYLRASGIAALADYDDDMLTVAAGALLRQRSDEVRHKPELIGHVSRLLLFLQNQKSSINKKINLQQLLLT